MGSAGVDADALRTTTNLVDFLAAVTAATTKNPLRDITASDPKAPNPLLWLENVPEDVEVATGDSDSALLELDPPSHAAVPKPPDELAERIDPERIRDFDGPEPQLLAPPDESRPDGRAPEDSDGPPAAVRRAYRKYVEHWRRWAEQERRAQRRRKLYEQLDLAAKRIESNDDEYEFVLAAGLVTWSTPEGDTLRRHLITEPVLPSLDRETARITVRTRSSEGRRLEDRELFEGRSEYVADRGRVGRSKLLEADSNVLGDQVLDDLHTWLGVVVQTPLDSSGDWAPPEPTDVLTLTRAPALLLRPRSKDKEAEAYKAIAQALRESGAQVPVALTQLVVDVVAERRDRWLREQNASRGDLIGADPLFPLPANDTQSRVLELLRTETSVVVQGPPGTGKTHTIANLISALLARGQRVLVTSQKDQALRVLRDKIPEELRQLCVLLAGGSKDASEELQRSLDALSEAVSTTDPKALAREAENLAAERDALRRRSAELNNEIRELRSVELVEHSAVVPGYRTDVYAGTLSDIVRQVQRRAEQYHWIPAVPTDKPDVPPLRAEEFLELRRLSLQDSVERRARADQRIPDQEKLPTPGELAKLIVSEQQAKREANADTSQQTRALASLRVDDLQELAELVDGTEAALHECQLESGGVDSSSAPAWVVRAVGDRLAGRNVGLWDQLVKLESEAGRLQSLLQGDGVRHHVTLSPITTENLGTAKGWLSAGRDLLGHFDSGGKLRRMMVKQVQKDAQPLMEAVAVNGSAPDDAEKLRAALDQLEAEVAVVQLAEKWSDAGVEIPFGKVAQTLSALHDNETWLARVSEVTAARNRLAAKLLASNVRVDLSTPDSLVSLLRAVPGAQRHAEAEIARNRVDELCRDLTAEAESADACPEIANLLAPVHDRDQERYAEVLSTVDHAREQQRDELRRAQLSRTLGQVHPRLLDVVRTADGPEWEQRLSAIADAWGWSKAEQFVDSNRNAERERELSREYDQVEDKVGRVTGQLAGTYAMRECLERMSDEHVAALRTYQQHMNKVGAGTGKRAKDFLKAAKNAMQKAKHAVPAWVVPLPNLLDTISAERDSFDVVIVDEASQVGLEQLYLLWMAPRVIVVGDDKQCTPQEGRLGKQDELFSRLEEHLPDLDHDIKLNFTGKSNLYGVLSARSGKDSVIRLREHFRCMPEIIHWSSTQFYSNASGKPGLIPLRQIEPDRLEPVKVTTLRDAYTEGRSEKRRNPVEAKRIVQTLVECIDDPRYAGKTFGVVVLQGVEQVKLLEHEINATVSPEARQERRIRVGNAANFQGDERDVIFLSMVVAEDAPRAVRATGYQQSYNVAASRAKDQLWLFASVTAAQLRSGDLRHSLLTYMQDPPSQYGKSPDLDEVPGDELCEPFDSVFEQKVFREIKQRGYHVVPQFELGSRKLDLVVVGERGRIAVECDGHPFHTSPQQQIDDARRDRELRRMSWETVRLRESEFEFDRERELQRMWTRFEEKGVTPHLEVPGESEVDWKPIELDDEDEGEPA